MERKSDYLQEELDRLSLLSEFDEAYYLYSRMRKSLPDGVCSSYSVITAAEFLITDCICQSVSSHPEGVSEKMVNDSIDRFCKDIKSYVKAVLDGLSNGDSDADLC